jgi:hypothetical protein
MLEMPDKILTDKVVLKVRDLKKFLADMPDDAEILHDVPDACNEIMPMSLNKVEEVSLWDFTGFEEDKNKKAVMFSYDDALFDGTESP